MHIITLDDQDFPDLLEVFKASTAVGNFIKDGHVQIVRANERLVMISNSSQPIQIAIHPARGTSEARKIATKFLELEAANGNTVTFK